MSSKKNKKQPVPANKPAPAIHTNVSGNNSVSKADDTSASLKEETLRWLFSILCALFVYWVVASIIQSGYHPDIQAMLDYAQKIGFNGDSRPEPMEALLFRAGAVTIIGCLLFFYFLFSKIPLVKNLAQGSFFQPFSGICVILVIGMAYFDFAAANPFTSIGQQVAMSARDLVGATNFTFYFDGLFIGAYLIPYTIVIVPLVALLFYFGIRKYHWEEKKVFNNAVSGITYVMAGGIILAIVLINTYEWPYTFECKYDINSLYYSVTQVYAGTPMLVNGFSNTYGLYPHFLNLIFQVTGLSVLKFTMVMSTLLGLSFILNFYVLKKMISNKVILLLGFPTIIVFPYLSSKYLMNFDSYFAFYPLRYVILSVVIFLSYLYSKRQHIAIYWATNVIMGCFILWNPEIGMVSYFGWLAFNTYNDFYTEEGKIAIKKIVLHWVIGIGNVVVIFLAYKFLIRVFYGVSPDTSFLFSNIVMVGKAGFGLLPMVLVHPWNITAFTIILGFIYAIAKWYNKEITPKASLVLLLSILSLGCFVYFQGRSHNWTFSTSCGCSLILMIILGDELWQKIKGNNIIPLHMLFVTFLFIISFSFFELLFNASKINALIYQEDNKENQLTEQNLLKKNTDFILAHSHEKEKIYLFTSKQYEGLYYDGYKRRSAFNPGLQDMALNSDLIKIEHEIIDSSFSIFIEPKGFAFPHYVRPIGALAACYEVTTGNDTMYLLNKRRAKVPGQTFFGQGNEIVVHKKYTDDSTGFKARINDALSTKPVAISAPFSVEVLFYPSKQIYSFAALLGNMDDSSGFLIANILGTKNYFFGINGKGFTTPMPDSQWVYLVMNVYPDHLEVFQNGNEAVTFPLTQPMRMSPEPLFIGNNGNLRYYVGAISEVAINSNVLDKNQVQQTWNAMKPVVDK